MIKIYDTVQKKVLWYAQCSNPELLGRLKSSLYTLIDGHMYYNNNIIKIRYDLLAQKNLRELKESEVFDFYSKILSLDQNETVKTRMPFCSFKYHRFVYMTANIKELKPNKIKILPFLHERRVYLSRMDNECEYFYTTIQQKKSLFFVCMNTTENKYQVYSQGGILYKNVDYSNQVFVYGPPAAVSNNG